LAGQASRLVETIGYFKTREEEAPVIGFRGAAPRRAASAGDTRSAARPDKVGVSIKEEAKPIAAPHEAAPAADSARAKNRTAIRPASDKDDAEFEEF